MDPCYLIHSCHLFLKPWPSISPSGISWIYCVLVSNNTFLFVTWSTTRITFPRFQWQHDKCLESVVIIFEMWIKAVFLLMISLKKEKENIQFQFAVVLRKPLGFLWLFQIILLSGRGVSCSGSDGGKEIL